MNFNFHEFGTLRRRRLFIPRSAFSFASFVVPIKFRQPTPPNAFLIDPHAQRHVRFKRSGSLGARPN